jgi:hypothetical protein
MAETRSIGNGAQADENLRKNSRLNYESAALPAELRRRICRRKITEKCAFREPLSCSRQCLFEANSDIPSSLIFEMKRPWPVARARMEFARKAGLQLHSLRGRDVAIGLECSEVLLERDMSPKI